VNRLDAGVDLRDVQIAAGHADPRTTRRYDRARKNLDRHLAAYIASGNIGGQVQFTRGKSRTKLPHLTRQLHVIAGSAHSGPHQSIGLHARQSAVRQTKSSPEGCRTSRALRGPAVLEENL
jgi:hypothetical protein